MEQALNQLERMVLPPSGANVGASCCLHNSALLSLPAGGGQVHAPYDETHRGVVGNLPALGENARRKYCLLRFRAQR